MLEKTKQKKNQPSLLLLLCTTRLFPVSILVAHFNLIKNISAHEMFEHLSDFQHNS